MTKSALDGRSNIKSTPKNQGMAGVKRQSVAVTSKTQIVNIAKPKMTNPGPAATTIVMPQKMEMDIIEEDPFSRKRKRPDDDFEIVT